MRFIGRREGLDAGARCARMDWAEERTARQRRASRCSWPSTTAAGRRSWTRREPSRVRREEEFRRHLYAPDMHDPDLLIRTSGEQRISNYLLWQFAYSEFVFRDELWPDFTREAFEASLEEYAARRRRFGGAVGVAARAASAPARRSDLAPRDRWSRSRRSSFALVIVDQGGVVFALGIFALGVVRMGELYTLMGRVRPAGARRLPDARRRCSPPRSTASRAT